MNEETFMPAEQMSRPLPSDRRPVRKALQLSDGYETGVYVHSPRGPAKRLPVVCLHGIQSHPGWFVGGADALAQAGYAVYQPIRRGSGDNTIARGHARSPEQLIDDVRTACRMAAGECGASAVHLVAISWGGKLAAACAATADFSPKIASLTLIAPGIAPKVDVSPRAKLRIALAAIFRPEKLFRIPLDDVDLFTDNLQMREYLRRDALRLHEATAKFLLASARLNNNPGRLRRRCIHAPTTLILAADDRIIHNETARGLVLRWTADAAGIIELPGCHTLEFEENPKAYWDALVQSVSAGE